MVQKIKMEKYQNLLAVVRTDFLMTMKEKSFKEASNLNTEWERCIKLFLYKLAEKGFRIRDNHISQINTTEYSIYYCDYDSNGFLNKRLIAYLRCIKGIYGGASVYLSDQDEDTTDCICHAG